LAWRSNCVSSRMVSAARVNNRSMGPFVHDGVISTLDSARLRLDVRTTEHRPPRFFADPDFSACSAAEVQDTKSADRGSYALDGNTVRARRIRESTCCAAFKPGWCSSHIDESCVSLAVFGADAKGNYRRVQPRATSRRADALWKSSRH
jgi:hypothetical protein